MVTLSDVGGQAGGLGVGRGGGGQVAAQLMQVAADGVPAVAVADRVAQPVGLAQPGGGAVHVADRDRAPEHGGGVVARGLVGEGDEVVVPREDLRPVGLRGARRVVVQGGDGGLDLVAAGAFEGQRRLQNAYALGDLARVPQAAVLAVERDDPARRRSARAARRAWLRSISASSPRASGSSVARVSWRASRIASPARSTRPAWPAV